MSSNRSAKLKLIQRYGEVDFLDRLKIKVPTNKKYKSKNQLKKMKQLTYHHIKEKSKGGDATVENGALLTAEHHAWFHQQPEETQKKLNNAFQELKRKIDSTSKVPIVFVEDDELDLPFEVSFVEMSIDKQGRLKAYNRTKKKKEDKKRIKEYEKDDDFYR